MSLLLWLLSAAKEGRMEISVKNNIFHTRDLCQRAACHKLVLRRNEDYYEIFSFIRPAFWKTAAWL